MGAVVVKGQAVNVPCTAACLASQKNQANNVLMCTMRLVDDHIGDIHARDLTAQNRKDDLPKCVYVKSTFKMITRQVLD